MSSNFLINTDIVNKQYPNAKNSNENALKYFLETNKNKKNKKSIIYNKNSKELNFFEDIKKLTDIKKSHNNSLILLNFLKKASDNRIVKKYNIENYNNKATQEIVMKKKFLSNHQ